MATFSWFCQIFTRVYVSIFYFLSPYEYKILRMDNTTGVWFRDFMIWKSNSGLWSGLDCDIKGSGPIMSNFWGLSFHFFRVNFFFENTIASALKSCIIPFYKKNFHPKKWKKTPFFECKYMKVGTRHLFSYVWTTLCLVTYFFLDFLPLLKSPYLAHFSKNEWTLEG